ncbi:MAG: hypothetical protein QE269_00705 [Fimbriimonas sp.]|nr:hypothetical protein [Fimbriimonas sp.]
MKSSACSLRVGATFEPGKKLLQYAMIKVRARLSGALGATLGKADRIET